MTSTSDTSGAHPDGQDAEPGRRRNERAHAAILAATIALLREVGYNRMTMEKVAARAGVGKATVYRWWHNKSALVIEAISQRLDSQMVQPSGDTRTDLRALIQRTVDTYTTSELGEVLAALAVDVARDPEANQLLSAVLGPRRAAHTALLYTAAARGDLPHDLDAQLILDIISGTIAFRSLLGKRPTAVLVDQLTELILDGRLPRATAGS
jgi:AcrR family transcriptional regulator